MSDPNSIGKTKPTIIVKPVYVEVKEEEKDFSSNPKLLCSEIAKLQKEYQLLLKKKSIVDKQAITLRNKIRSYVEILLFIDWDLCIQKDLLFQFWKTVDHYTFQEFRKLLKKAESSEENTETEKLKKVNESIRLFLTTTLEQYQKLLQKLQDAIAAIPELSSSFETRKKISQYYFSKLYLIMGDLERYIQTHKPKDSIKDFSLAKEYYLTALHSDFCSAICHNQLAVITSFTFSEDPLEVALCSKEMLYRYYRALSVPKPFTTAKDNLILLLEKNRLTFVKAHQDAMEKQKQQQQHSHHSHRGGRGGTRITTSNKSMTIQSGQLDTFLLYFIRLHGILYTKTSYETFDEIKTIAIKGLNHLLSKHEMILSETLLLELTLINIFEIENCSTVEVLYPASIALACAMMKQAIDCSLDIHPHSYLQSIAIFLKYVRMVFEKSITFQKEHFLFEDKEMWSSIALLLNALNEISTTTTLSGENGVVAVLSEDVECLGFAPLMDSNTPPLELYSPWNDDIIQQKEKQIGEQQVMSIRMERIKQEATKLLPFTNQYLWFDRDDKLYRSGEKVEVQKVMPSQEKVISQKKSQKDGTRKRPVETMNTNNSSVAASQTNASQNKKQSSQQPLQQNSKRSYAAAVVTATNTVSNQSTPDNIFDSSAKIVSNNTKPTTTAVSQQQQQQAYLFNENDEVETEEDHHEVEQMEEDIQQKGVQEFFLFQPSTVPLLKPSDVTKSVPTVNKPTVSTSLLEKPFGNSTSIHEDKFFSQVSVLKHQDAKNSNIPALIQSPLKKPTENVVELLNPSSLKAASSPHKESFAFYQPASTPSKQQVSTITSIDMPFASQQPQQPSQQSMQEYVNPFGMYWGCPPFMMPPSTSMNTSLPQQPFMPNFPANAPTKEIVPPQQPPAFLGSNTNTFGFIPPNILHQFYQQRK